MRFINCWSVVLTTTVVLLTKLICSNQFKLYLISIVMYDERIVKEDIHTSINLCITSKIAPFQNFKLSNFLNFLTFYIEHSINVFIRVHFHNSVSMVTWHITWWRHSISPLYHVVVTSIIIFICSVNTDISCDLIFSCFNPKCAPHQDIPLQAIGFTLASLHVAPLTRIIATTPLTCSR